MAENAFLVDLEYKGANRPHVLRCRGTFVPLRRGSRKGCPDDWTEDEGGYAEDLKVELVRDNDWGHHRRELSTACVERLRSFGDLDEALLERLEYEENVRTEY